MRTDTFVLAALFVGCGAAGCGADGRSVAITDDADLADSAKFSDVAAEVRDVAAEAGGQVSESGTVDADAVADGGTDADTTDGG